MNTAAAQLIDPLRDDPEVGHAALRWIELQGQSRGLNALARMLRGVRTDELSRASLAAWRQRWWREAEGRDRRLAHYALAAEVQADPDLADDSAPGAARSLAIMPLGAARGLAPKTGAYWLPGEAKVDKWLATLPIFTEATPGSLIAADLLAWLPDAPGKWWGRTGALSVLGRERLAHALAYDKPLRVYRTPLAWNRAGGGSAPGCCILDWESPEGLECRVFARALIGDDLAHVRELKRLIEKRRPRLQFVARKRG